MRHETIMKGFSFERLALLMRNRFLDDLNAFLVSIAAVVGINLLSILMNKAAVFNSMGGGANASPWAAMISVGGVLLAGRAFLSMHNGRGGSDWILLPASPLEKYLAAFLSYLLLYPVAASLASFALSAVFEGFALAFSAPAGAIFDPASLANEGALTAYAFFVCFALAASARFAKLPLVKVGALGAAWGIAFMFLFMVGLAVATPEGREALAHRRLVLESIEFDISSGGVRETALTWLLRASFYVSILFAAVYGYFRIAEKESVDEVQ